MQVLIFSYGSNMLYDRLKIRVPSAVRVGIGHALQYRLKWHKRSKDGSAKCDMEFSDKQNDCVWGVLYAVNVIEKSHLDRAEGLGAGYVERFVEVRTAREAVSALAYVATDLTTDHRPYDWYKAYVVAGARENNLPADYVHSLTLVPSKTDLDKRRAEKHFEALGGRGTDIG